MAFFAATVCLGFLALGCAAQEVTDEPPRSVDHGGEEPVSQIGLGGTVRVSMPTSTAPSCFNPYLGACAGASNLDGVVFEGLLEYGPSGDFRPLLARAVPAYGDGTLSLEPMSVEVSLREAAAFSDGEPVTAEDIVWTYSRAMELADEGRISPELSGFSRLEAVEATGERSVRLDFEGPYAGWRDLLTAPVLPEHVYADAVGLSGLTLSDEPVGSGPFLLEEFRGGGGLDFTASPRYWTEELKYPRLDGLSVQYEGPGDATRSLASSNADFGVFIAGDAPESGDLVRAPALRQRTELLVFDSEGLDEPTRAAISSNVDRTSLAETVGMDQTGRVFATVPNTGEARSWDELSPEGTPTDLSGTSLRLAYPAGGPVRDTTAREIAAELERAGAEIEVERVPGGEFYASTLPEGDFDLTLLDLGRPAEYEALRGVLPDLSAGAIYTSLGRPEDEARYLRRTQEILAAEYALAPLFVWPDTFAWSSRLSGPEDGVTTGSLMRNVREWGFYK